jgi:acetoacetate decarboxylase
MPDHGRLTEDLVPHTTPLVAPPYPPPPWRLPGATVLKFVFETDTESVLTWLPPKLTRSSPPYAVITVEHYPESPVGPFSMANQYIGCRAGFFIRAFALQSIVSEPLALAALREVWGYPAQLGEVSLNTTRNGAQAGVRRNGNVLLDARLEDAQPLEPELTRFDPVLTLRLIPSLQEAVRHDLVQMVQIDPDLEVTAAFRGTGAFTYSEGTGGDSWSVLPNRNLISTVCCTIDTELPLARFVMPY